MVIHRGIELTEKQMIKHFGNLEDHQYRHYNNALGCWVEGKEHYKWLLRKGNMIPFGMAEELVKEPARKEYKLSDDARKFINEIKLTADSKGNVRLGTRAIERMKELGVRFDQTEAELEAFKQNK